MGSLKLRFLKKLLLRNETTDFFFNVQLQFPQKALYRKIYVPSGKLTDQEVVKAI